MQVRANGPAISEVRAALGELRKKAKELYSFLLNLDFRTGHEYLGPVLIERGIPSPVNFFQESMHYASVLAWAAGDILRSPARGGRPKESARAFLIGRLLYIYADATGERPTASLNGSFMRFVRICLEYVEKESCDLPEGTLHTAIRSVFARHRKKVVKTPTR